MLTKRLKSCCYWDQPFPVREKMSLTQRIDRYCFCVVFVVLLWIRLFQCFDYTRTIPGLVAGNSKNLGHTMNMIDDDDDDGDGNINYGLLNGQSDNAAAVLDPNWKDYRQSISGNIKRFSHGRLNSINYNDNYTKDDDDYDYSTGISVEKNLHIKNDVVGKRKRMVGQQQQLEQHQQKTKFHYLTSINNNNNNNKTQPELVMAKARLANPNGINRINGNMKISKKPKNKKQKITTTTTTIEKQQRLQNNNNNNNNHHYNNNGKNMENVVVGRFNLFHSKTDPLSWFWSPSPSSSSSSTKWKQEVSNRKQRTTTITTTNINNDENTNENELSLFCLEVKCGPDEYCFIPEVGVAECLKKENVKKLVHDNVHGRHPNSNNNNNNIDNKINRATKQNNKNKNKNKWSNKDSTRNLMDLEDNNGDDDDEDDDVVDDSVDYDQHYKRKKNGGKFNRNKNQDQDVGHSRQTFLANQQRKFQSRNMNGQGGNQIKNANISKSLANNVGNKTKIIQCPSCPFTHGQIICGTDNATYSSMCRIEFHNCIHETNVKFACFGFCPCTKISNNNNNNNSGQIGDHWNSMDHPEILLLNQNHTKHLRTGKFEESLQRYHYDLDHGNVPNGNNAKNCTPEELHSMGVRLLDWFLVVMKEEIKLRNKSNIKHQASSGSRMIQTELPDCEEQVSFMFYHFDLDHNFKLTTKELYYLKHDENEHCLEPYLLQCDEDRDDLLSAHEWCSCFDFRSKPCLYQRKQVLKKNPQGLKPWQYVPQCDPNGHFRNVQCNPSNNYCWCSDKNGNEIAGTGVHGRLAICDKVYPLSRNRYNNNKRIQPPTSPQQQQQQILVSQHPIKKPLANSNHKSRLVLVDDDDDESGDDDEDDGEEGSFSMDPGSGLDSF